MMMNDINIHELPATGKDDMINYTILTIYTNNTVLYILHNAYKILKPGTGCNNQ